MKAYQTYCKHIYAKQMLYQVLQRQAKQMYYPVYYIQAKQVCYIILYRKLILFQSNLNVKQQNVQLNFEKYNHKNQFKLQHTFLMIRCTLNQYYNSLCSAVPPNKPVSSKLTFLYIQFCRFLIYFFLIQQRYNTQMQQFRSKIFWGKVYRANRY